jgi:hypothetical protein
MNDQDVDKRVEELLSRKEAYLADDGFTAAVMQALPARRSFSAWARALIVIAAASCAAAIVVFATPDSRYIIDAVKDVFVSPLAMRIPSIASVIIVGLTIWGAIATVRTGTEPA